MGFEIDTHNTTLFLICIYAADLLVDILYATRFRR